MTGTNADSDAEDWSRADHPEAIALSEIQWWAWAAELSVRRVRTGQGPQQQIDARFLVLSLAQLRTSARIGLDVPNRQVYTEPAAAELAQAIARFDQVVPDVKDARDVLVHLDDYTVGHGRMQKPKQTHQIEKRSLATEYTSGVGYYPPDDEVRVGIQRYRFALATVVDAVVDLVQAVHRAGAFPAPAGPPNEPV